MQLAVQDWRVRFSVMDGGIEVLEILSGYRPSQLDPAKPTTDSAIALHRQFALGQVADAR